MQTTNEQESNAAPPAPLPISQIAIVVKDMDEALERYHDRSVLSVSALVEEPLRVGPSTPGAGRVEVWDGRGRRYQVAAIHGADGLDPSAVDRPVARRRGSTMRRP